jgi:hypothetical protein
VRKASPSTHPDTSLEEAQLRHEAILDVIEALRTWGKAREKLGEAEAGLRYEILGAMALGIRQAEIARRLGWTRQHVNRIVRTDES